MSDGVSVACAVSGPYALPLAVLIRSLIANRGQHCPVTFYIFADGLSDHERDRLERTTTGDGVSLVWVQPDLSRMRGLPMHAGMSLATYFRLSVDELPATVTKLVWLDTDLLVLRDIGELSGLDMGGHPVLAVQDMAVPFVSSPWGVGEWQALGLAAGAPNFNAGVMLIDLNIWRKEEIGLKALHYLRSRPQSVALYDQEALNAVLAGRWGGLDPRWNQIASLAGRSFHRSAYLAPEAYRRAVEDPWILHFAGDWKPWTLPYGRHPYHLYFDYLDQTPWSGWRPRPSLVRGARAFYHEHLRDALYPIESLYTGLRLRRFRESLRDLPISGRG